MAEKEKYYIRVHNELVSVTKEVYRANNSAKRQIRTQRDRDKRHGLLSIQAFDTETITGEEIMSDPLAESVEEQVIAAEMSAKLHTCLALLLPEERELIQAIFFEDKSERKLSQEISVPQKTINDRKRRILRKLKKLMENTK